jgi:hypothetical protein
VRASAAVARSPQSGLTSTNREKLAEFASLVETKTGFSLLFRLNGGEGGIRTLSPAFWRIRRYREEQEVKSGSQDVRFVIANDWPQ